MLTKAMKKFVKSKDKSGYTDAVKIMYNKRIVRYALEGLKDFNLIAEYLSEDQQAQIFNKENLLPFLQTLFKLDIDPIMTEEKLEMRRKRLLALCFEFLYYLGGMYALKLAPTAYKMLQRDVPRGIQAILMEAYS